METDKNYFLVGLFVVVLILGGLVFTLWLTSIGRGPTVGYRIHFSESVGGLKVGSMVKFQGVDVGNVKKLAIEPEDPHSVRVDIHVLEAAPIKADTTACLKFLGISGDMYVELAGGNPNEPNLAATGRNDEPPEIRSEPSSLNAIMDRLPKLINETDHLLAKADHIADQVDKVFSDKNVKSVNSILGGLGSHFGDEDSKKDSEHDHND